MSGLVRPCPGCPFGRHPDAVLGIRPARLREIVRSEGGFPCHQTVEETAKGSPKEELQCAGYYIFHLVNESAPQMMRIEGRLGFIDVPALLANASECVTDLDELLERHASRNRRS